MKVSIRGLQVRTPLSLFLRDIFSYVIIGIALLYWRLAQLFPDERENYKSRAKVYVDAALGKLSGEIKIYTNVLMLRLSIGRRTSFLCGDPGPLAIGAAIYNELGLSYFRLFICSIESLV
jgi:hypothetical protein